MTENPSRRINKAYVVLLLSYPEEGDGGVYDSASIVYVTLDKTKADEIENLWNIVEKERHQDDNKVMKALNDLKTKFGISCWSREEMRIEEENFAMIKAINI